jgi:hypothetical protein
LTLKDLAKFDRVSLTAVMQCSGNGRAFHRPRAAGVQWERGAVGNAKWTGVRLRDVLSHVGVQPSARHLQMLGADRPVVAMTPLFLRSIPIEKAMHPDTLLATHMNGEPLPLLHGAPLRLITPGWMGDACVKWLTDLTLLAEEAKGFYMETAYRYPAHPVEPGTAVPPRDMIPVEAMVVKSLIVTPVSGTAFNLTRSRCPLTTGRLGQMPGSSGKMLHTHGGSGSLSGSPNNQVRSSSSRARRTIAVRPNRW